LRISRKDGEACVEHTFFMEREWIDEPEGGRRIDGDPPSVSMWEK